MPRSYILGAVYLNLWYPWPCLACQKLLFRISPCSLCPFFYSLCENKTNLCNCKLSKCWIHSSKRKLMDINTLSFYQGSFSICLFLCVTLACCGSSSSFSHCSSSLWKQSVAVANSPALLHTHSSDHIHSALCCSYPSCFHVRCNTQGAWGAAGK